MRKEQLSMLAQAKLAVVVALTCLFTLADVAPADAQLGNAESPCHTPPAARRVCVDPLGGNQQVVLQPGLEIERPLNAGQSHQYNVSLTSGEYVQVIVNQKGVDVTVKLSGPATEVLMDTPNGQYGLERVSAIAPEDSNFAIEVRANASQTSGCYSIVMTRPRIATEEDKRQVLASRAFADAVRAAPQARDGNSIQAVIDKYEQALADYRLARDEYGEAETLSGVAFQYGRIGRTEKAIEYLTNVLSFWETFGDRRREAQTLNNSGTLYLRLGNIGFALDCYLRSLPLWCATGDRVGEATARNNIASIYTEVNDHRKALLYYEQTLNILRELPGTDAQQAVLLNNIGGAYEGLKDRGKAITYYGQSLQIRRQLPGGDPLGVARTLNNLALAQLFRGDLVEAEKALRDSLVLRLNKDRWGEAASMYGLGLLFKIKKQRSEALEQFRKALAINRELQDSPREAITLYAIATVERDDGSLDAAIEHIDNAIRIIERVSKGYSNDELRTGYLSSVQEIYQFYIDLLMQMDAREPQEGFAARAFTINEQARARIFLDLLASARVDIYQDVDRQLVKEERELSTALNIQANRYNQLMNVAHTPEQETAAKVQLETARAQLQQIRSKIRDASPRYKELTQPEILSVDEVQKKLLDNDSILLEYALGTTRSFLWVVTRTSLSTYHLPGRTDIEKAATRFHALLGERGRDVKGEDQHQRNLRIARADAEATALSQSLGRILLDPVAAHLGNRRLIIVADGALQYIPFAALPVRNASGSSSKRLNGTQRRLATETIRSGSANMTQPSVPLVVDHEIVMMPSASSLAAHRSNVVDRKPASKAIAIFADPVYSVDDARVKALVRIPRSGKNEGQSESPIRDVLLDMSRAEQDSSQPTQSISFDRLDASGWEGQRIYELASPGERLLALDFDANHNKATAADVGDYRIVHFSAHGLIDDIRPELSGIALSMVDNQGQPVDGFLRLHEIYNLNMPVDLVVLNACETALGEDVQGEGLIGLTRGFMHAGAARVIVTLWPMKDRAAAEFSVRFYKRIFGPNRLSALQAMRATQVEMATNPKFRRWRLPYYWSGYTLFGVW